MQTAIVTMIGLVLFGALALWARRRLESLPAKQKKALVKKTINDVFSWFEDRGLLERTPAFTHDYLEIYPGLRDLEANHAAVQRECMALLDIKNELADMSAMGGSYTQAGIHTASWKTFMFKSGAFIEENCTRCPQTAALLRNIPGLYTAFFSVLEPHQKLTPHWGYYKGFQRYHLGVIIPKNNEDRSCYLRVNADRDDNARRDPELIEKGEIYYWKNGEGILFDDNYLHDAANLSDEPRVILWLDMRRKMPFYIQAFNILCLAVAQRDSSMKKIRENAVVRFPG